MLSIKKLMTSSLVRTAAFIGVALFTSATIADNSQQPLQLAALSDGFNTETTYMASCFACHSTGAAGAPKVGAGNAEAWAPRLEKGMEAIMSNVIKGVNSMPPKGLCFNCTDDDLRAVVDYMIASSK